MRGPGEATGSFALESAMDELAYVLKKDPLEFRILNHSDSDPERNLPWSSKFVKDCYELGSDKIGWKNRKLEPKSLKDGDWLIGYGMGTGAFGAFRGAATIKAILTPDGKLTLQCSVNDMGPGTATMMTTVASNALGIPVGNIKVEMGSTSLPPGPTQGGSTVTSTVGAAVYDTCVELREKIAQLAGTPGSSLLKGNATVLKSEELQFSETGIAIKNNGSAKLSYSDLLKDNNLTALEITKESKGQQQPYSMYSFSVHFVKLRVHQPTGRIKIDHVVSCADAGTIVSEKTAASQMMGGAVGGIGMALMEDIVHKSHGFKGTWRDSIGWSGTSCG
jgi:xanthine dehydrogenase YagR molybdenum-binding subunit